jgi:hypothetical protein
MTSFFSSRLLIAGVCVGILTACQGGGADPPPPAKKPSSVQRVSAFAESTRTASAARATDTVVFPGHCNPVTTSKGPLTAKIVATGPIGHTDVDASGCDIGIYAGTLINGLSIDHVTVHDAKQYGIFADQAENVTIDHTQVFKIGNHDTTGAFAPNGVKTGVGLYFRGATGSVDHTDLYQYQKNGTAFNCLFSDAGACVKPSSVSMQHSTATGLGTVNYIAQNGIQYLDSTAPVFAHNTATNNMYLNPLDPVYNQSSTGYLFLCTNVTSEAQLRDQHNEASHNDVNYYVDNNPADC